MACSLPSEVWWAVFALGVLSPNPRQLRKTGVAHRCFDEPATLERIEPLVAPMRLNVGGGGTRKVPCHADEIELGYLAPGFAALGHHFRCDRHRRFRGNHHFRVDGAVGPWIRGLHLLGHLVRRGRLPLRNLRDRAGTHSAAHANCRRRGGPKQGRAGRGVVRGLGSLAPYSPIMVALEQAMRRSLVVTLPSAAHPLILREPRLFVVQSRNNPHHE